MTKWICMLGLLAVVGCGGNNSTPTAPTSSQLNVSGTWTGTTSDNLGTGPARATLAQSGNSISGTWSTGSGATTNGGSVNGSSAGTNVSLSLVPSDPRTCGFTVTASVTGGNRMSGSYAAAKCTVVVTGTLTLTKQ